MNDPSVRCALRQAQGFCNEHAWALAARGDSLGVALLMCDVLDSMLEPLHKVCFRAVRAAPLRRFLASKEQRERLAPAAEVLAKIIAEARCPACVQQEKMERISAHGRESLEG